MKGLCGSIKFDRSISRVNNDHRVGFLSFRLWQSVTVDLAICLPVVSVDE